MKPILAFDVDGTLTHPREAMLVEHEKKLIEIFSNNHCYLITGSDLPKLLEQVPYSIIKLTHGVFTCAGAQFWRPDLIEDLNMRAEFTPPLGLIERLNDMLTDSPYPERYGNHIEMRVGMLNFSIPGRACGKEERSRYSKWDSLNEERVRLAKELRESFKGIHVSVGGQISIDISGAGIDKGRAIKLIRSLVGKKPIWFFGDKLTPEGNDWPVIGSMYGKDKALQVYGPDDLLSLWAKVETTNVFGKT